MLKSGYEMSVTERRLADVLLNAENRSLNKSQLAEKAGISRPTLNKILKNESFMQEINNKYTSILISQQYKVLQALLSSAQLEGKNGFQDRKLFLELISQYQEVEKDTTEEQQLVFDIKPTDSDFEKKEYNTVYHNLGGVNSEL